MLGKFFKRFNKDSSIPDNKAKQIDMHGIPSHIAIIMDGNGRWAQKRKLPRTAGHRAGVESLKITVETCAQLGVKALTVYAFSTENWKRPQEEVNILMDLLTEYIDKELVTLHKKGIKVSALGQIDKLPAAPKESLKKAQELTINNKKMSLNIALNYGGRAEILYAATKIAEKVSNKQIEINEIDESVFAAHLYTKHLPEPDLLIRPSGEKRISNFLLWQLAYTEFWYTDVLWPDFQAEHLYEAIKDYQQRERRYGGLKL